MAHPASKPPGDPCPRPTLRVVSDRGGHLPAPEVRRRPTTRPAPERAPLSDGFVAAGLLGPMVYGLLVLLVLDLAGKTAAWVALGGGPVLAVLVCAGMTAYRHTRRTT